MPGSIISSIKETLELEPEIDVSIAGRLRILDTHLNHLMGTKNSIKPWLDKYPREVLSIDDRLTTLGGKEKRERGGDFLAASLLL